MASIHSRVCSAVSHEYPPPPLAGVAAAIACGEERGVVTRLVSGWARCWALALKRAVRLQRCLWASGPFGSAAPGPWNLSFVGRSQLGTT